MKRVRGIRTALIVAGVVTLPVAGVIGWLEVRSEMALREILAMEARAREGQARLFESVPPTGRSGGEEARRMLTAYVDAGRTSPIYRNRYPREPRLMFAAFAQHLPLLRRGLAQEKWSSEESAGPPDPNRWDEDAFTFMMSTSELLGLVAIYEAQRGNVDQAYADLEGLLQILRWTSEGAIGDALFMGMRMAKTFETTLSGVVAACPPEERARFEALREDPRLQTALGPRFQVYWQLERIRVNARYGRPVVRGRLFISDPERQTRLNEQAEPVEFWQLQPAERFVVLAIMEEFAPVLELASEGDLGVEERHEQAVTNLLDRFGSDSARDQYARRLLGAAVQEQKWISPSDRQRHAERLDELHRELMAWVDANGRLPLGTEEAGLDLNFELEGMFAFRNMKEYVRLTMYPGPPYPRGIAEVRVIYAPLTAGP